MWLSVGWGMMLLFLILDGFNRVALDGLLCNGCPIPSPDRPHSSTLSGFWILDFGFWKANSKQQGGHRNHKIMRLLPQFPLFCYFCTISI